MNETPHVEEPKEMLYPDETEATTAFGEDILESLPEPTAEEIAETEAAMASTPRRGRKKTTSGDGKKSSEKTAGKRKTASKTVKAAEEVPVKAVEEKVAISAAAPAPVDRVEAAMLHTEIREQRQDNATSVGTFTTAMKTNAILEGEIAGVEVDAKNAYWVLFQNNITVRIPFEESFMIQPEELRKEVNSRILMRRKQFLTKSMGATIPYVLTDFVAEPDGSYVAYGSRISAMARIRRRYFGDDAPQKLSVGQVVTAQIISGDAHTAYVYTCGCDVRVPNHLLTHRYIEDVSAAYMVGTNVRLQVRQINKEPGKPPQLVLNGRPVELEACKPNLKRIRGTNPRFIGVITSIRMDRRPGDEPSVVAHLWLKGAEVPAFCRDFRLNIFDEIHTGDTVSFECNGVTESGYVHGRIIRYNHSV